MSLNYKVNGIELDDNQMSLLKKDTNSLIVAGAGSGKTLSILGKANYLIEKKYCKPNEILIISFTNTSVNDIIKKIKFNNYRWS